ncbi:MAG: carboxypeptidase regulatory-like domain-containing protein [Bacteroidia bacterium]
MKKFSHIIFTFLTVALLGNSATVFAQVKADKYFAEYAYSKAIIKYEKYLKKHSSDIKAWSNLGDCYRLTNNMQGAEQAYSHVINTDFSKPQITYYYAQALMSNGKYAEAKENISKYKQEVPNDKRADEILSALDSINQFYKDSASWHIEKVNINSADGDFSPAIYKDGIVFTSNRNREQWIGRKHTWTGKQFNALYYSKGKDAIFETPQPFANEIQTKYNNGPVSFNGSGNEMFFTRNNIVNGKVIKSGNKVVKLKIFSTKFSNNEWQPEIPFDYDNNQYSVAHPSLSADGYELYFSSDVMGGYGGMDIYSCHREGAKWSRPINLGPSINTKGNEVFPYIATDSTLYFSSDGHSGLGGLDIYYCTISNKIFSEPVNPGYPLNSNNDDFGITYSTAANAGYFSSNRNNQGENDDIFYLKKLCIVINGFVYDDSNSQGIPTATVKIKETGSDKEIKLTDSAGNFSICLTPGKDYEFIADKENYIGDKRIISAKDFTGFDHTDVKIPLHQKPPVVFIARGNVYDEGSKKPVRGAKVTKVNLTTQKSDSLITKKDGDYYFTNLEPETRYRLVVEKENCGTNSEEITTVGMKDSPLLVNDIGIFCKGDVVRIENIYYDLNKYNIRPDAATELNKLVAVLRKYPNMKIELRSHTDSRASDAYNLTLSDNRAKAAIAYIISQGIDKNRLTGKGYGETQLLNRCKNGVKCTEEEHQLNRRTEFKILSL